MPGRSLYGAEEPRPPATSQTSRRFGIASDRRPPVFLYLLTQPDPFDFRQFLERHAELFRTLSAWCLRLLVPRHLRGAAPRYEAAFHEQLAMPLRPATRDELQWYFRTRQAGGTSRDPRFSRASRAFGAPRFQALYKTWLEVGDSVVEATVSAVLADAIARRVAHMECQMLTHRYLHLFPLVATA